MLQTVDSERTFRKLVLLEQVGSSWVDAASRCTSPRDCFGCVCVVSFRQDVSCLTLRANLVGTGTRGTDNPREREPFPGGPPRERTLPGGPPRGGTLPQGDLPYTHRRLFQMWGSWPHQVCLGPKPDQAQHSSIFLVTLLVKAQVVPLEGGGVETFTRSGMRFSGSTLSSEREAFVRRVQLDPQQMDTRQQDSG